MNHTIGGEDVDGHNTAIEVDCQTSEGDLESNTLWLGLRRQVIALEKGRRGVCLEHTSGWVEAINDVIRKKCLELLLAWLGSMLWDLLEGLVRRREQLVKVSLS